MGGSRVDQIRNFETLEEAKDFVKKFNASNNFDTAPDWYMVASEPKEYIVE